MIKITSFINKLGHKITNFYSLNISSSFFSFFFQLKEEYEGKVEKLRREVAFLSGKKRDENGDSIEDGTVLKPEDDPVADMTQQLISNREKIEMLTRQNERLTKTLSRLRKYRLTSQS